MAGLWDGVMKRQVRGYAKHFTRWLAGEAVFVRASAGTATAAPNAHEFCAETFPRD